MRKIWLIVIALAIVTAVVLAYTWQSVPILNTFLIDSGVVASVQSTTTGITEAVNNLDPKSLLGIISGSVGSFLLIGKTLMTRIREGREQTQQLRVLAQEEKGTLLAGFSDAKEALTGNITQLKEEYASLEGELATAKTVIDGKDDKIIAVQDALNKVQAELNAEKSRLLETTKQMDEYRIALEQKSVPTLN